MRPGMLFCHRDLLLASINVSPSAVVSDKVFARKAHSATKHFFGGLVGNAIVNAHFQNQQKRMSKWACGYPTVFKRTSISQTALGLFEKLGWLMTRLATLCTQVPEKNMIRIAALFVDTWKQGPCYYKGS